MFLLFSGAFPAFFRKKAGNTLETDRKRAESFKLICGYFLLECTGLQIRLVTILVGTAKVNCQGPNLS